MADSVTVRFPYSATEHAAAVSVGVGRRRLLSWFRFFGASCIAAGVLVLGIGAASHEPAMQLLKNAVGFTALGGFWIWGAQAVLRVIETRQLRREGSADGREHETRTFGRDGFTPTAHWSPPIPWTHVEQVVETESFLLIYASSDGPFYIPRHALLPTERSQLDALLREAFHSRPKQLVLLPRAT